MAEFFDIKDIRKIDFNKLVRLLPGGAWWNPFSTRGEYISTILRSQKIFLQNNIDSALRIAHFLGQGLIETGFLQYKSENLNYSAERLLEIFPRHFDGPAEARRYANKPEKIANRVYANRLGNGDEASGDGWRYRGRGFFQLTGKDNYRRYGEIAGIDLVGDPEVLEKDLKKSIEVAAAYFNKLGLGSYADQNDIRAVSRGVNRGDPEARSPAHGEADRIVWTKRVLDLVRNPGKIVEGLRDDASRMPEEPEGLSIGDRGDDVADVQRALNLLGYAAGSEDGVFGINTERAVYNFQRENGLDPTGAVDAATMAALDDALADVRKSLPPERQAGNAADAQKAGKRGIGDSRQVGNAGAAVGGAGAAGAAAETGALDGVVEAGREAVENMTSGAKDGEQAGDQEADTAPDGAPEGGGAPAAGEAAADETGQTAEGAAAEPAAPESETSEAETTGPETTPAEGPAEPAAETPDTQAPADGAEEASATAGAADVETEGATEGAGQAGASSDATEGEASPSAAAEVASAEAESAEADASETTPDDADRPTAPPSGDDSEASTLEREAAPSLDSAAEDGASLTEDEAAVEATPAPSTPVEEAALEPAEGMKAPMPADEADEPAEDPVAGPAPTPQQSAPQETTPEETTTSTESPAGPLGPGLKPAGEVDWPVVGLLGGVALFGLFIFSRSRRVAKDQMDAWRSNRLR